MRQRILRRKNVGRNAGIFKHIRTSKQKLRKGVILNRRILTMSYLSLKKEKNINSSVCIRLLRSFLVFSV